MNILLESRLPREHALLQLHWILSWEALAESFYCLAHRQLHLLTLPRTNIKVFPHVMPKISLNNKNEQLKKHLQRICMYILTIVVIVVVFVQHTTNSARADH